MAEVLMDYQRVNWLAEQLETAAGGLSARFSYYHPSPNALHGALSVLAPAFGNTPGAADCHASWQATSSAARNSVLNLAWTLEADASRLEQVVYLFERMDHDRADELASAGNTLTIISSHMHHNPDTLPGEFNDELRGHQINRVVDYAAGLDGPVVVGGDNNVSLVPDQQRDHDQHGVDALNGYDANGFMDVGDVGPTIGSRAIDHIFARGLAADEPLFVNGGPSDHNGQAATFLLTDW